MLVCNSRWHRNNVLTPTALKPFIIFANLIMPFLPSAAPPGSSRKAILTTSWSPQFRSFLFRLPSP